MTNHKATARQWERIKRWARGDDPSSECSCILEQLCRIEALEAAQQPPQDKLDRLIALDRDDPAASPIKRVATDAELCQVYNDAPEHGFGPAIRAVYDLGRQHARIESEGHLGNGLHYAKRLEQEATR
jgi:hypothetical protein